MGRKRIMDKYDEIYVRDLRSMGYSFAKISSIISEFKGVSVSLWAVERSLKR